MTKKEWEQQVGYTRLHNCIGCKYSTRYEYAPYRFTLECEQKIKAGVGRVVRGNYYCNLWEKHIGREPE